MPIKRALIKELNVLIKKEKELREKIKINPVSEICKIRIELGDIMNKYGNTSKEAYKFAKKNIKKEESLFEIAKENKYPEMMDELINIENDIDIIRNEISGIEYREEF